MLPVLFNQPYRRQAAIRAAGPGTAPEIWCLKRKGQHERIKLIFGKLWEKKIRLINFWEKDLGKNWAKQIWENCNPERL
jgi:hypothetical protein